MVTFCKKLLYIGLSVLLTALPGISSAQPMPENVWITLMETAEIGQAEDKGMQRPGAPPAGVPVGMLISEQGVILEDNKSYTLRIIIECLMPMEPRHVQKLLSSNRSLEEIRESIGDTKGEPIYRGNMKLGDKIYPLTNIRIAHFADNKSILEAEVAKPVHDPALIEETTVIGLIRMIIEPLKDGRGIAGISELQMNNSTFGKYTFKLDKAPSLRESKWGYEDAQRQKDMPMQKAPESPEATFSQGGLN